MIKRIGPAIDRRFEGRALMDGAAGSALVVGAMAIVLAALALVRSRVPGGLGALLLLVVVGAIIVAACLRYPPLAVVILLGAMFLRLALPHLIVADPFLIAYALAVVSAAVWMWQQRHALPRVTFVEVAMVLYTLWCYGSMVLPHQYPPVEFPLNGQLTAVPRFIELSAVIPFTMYLLGRRLFTRESAVRFVLWSILGFAAYSTLVSICQFSAPSLVWPRYIVDAPAWPGRAVGVFNQPVGNGMVLIIGFVIAIVLASDRGEPAWRRALLWLYALTSTLAIYLTHTRAIYLAFALVLILGVLLVPGARGVFAGLIGAITLVIGLNWSTFTSSDRAAGGVGSKGEVWDRLNAYRHLDLGLQAGALVRMGHQPIRGGQLLRPPAVVQRHPVDPGAGHRLTRDRIGHSGRAGHPRPAAVAVRARPHHRSAVAGVLDPAVRRTDRPTPGLRRHLCHGYPDRVRLVRRPAADRWPDLHGVLDLRNGRGGP